MNDQNKQFETVGEKVEKLYELIDKVDVALLTTRRSDGHLVSRPMASQDRAPGADLWFVTAKDSGKLEEILGDPHVNVTYYREKTREWVSVSGQAFVTDDRKMVRRLYKPDWKIYFPEETGGDGSAEDPRIVLIGIEAQSVVFMTSDKPGPLALFEIARAFVTGSSPDLGEMHRLTPGDLNQTRH
jgi:general stress protein 26